MEVLAGHPAFARFHELAFVRQTGLGGEVISDTSLPWFRRIKNEGSDRVRLHLAGMRADKTADEPWGLLTDGDRGLEIWTPALGRRFHGHDDAMPLRLTMASSRYNRWSLIQPISVEQASSNLIQALEATAACLQEGGQGAAANVVGKFLSLHREERHDLTGDLAPIAADLEPCSVALFASGARVLSLVETTGWLGAADPDARALGEPLWTAARIAIETAV